MTILSGRLAGLAIGLFALTIALESDAAAPTCAFGREGHGPEGRDGEVGTVGGFELGSFLAPVDSAIDAAFIAQVATQGAVDCTTPAARAVPGGFEVITTRVQTCGGRVDELRVLVDASGVATLVEMVKVRGGSGGVCP